MSRHLPFPPALCRHAVSVIVVVLTGMLASPTAQAQFQAPVIVQELVQRDAKAGQTFVASVEPTQSATVGSAVSGRVVEFPARVGERVEDKGTLAQLLTATIKLERDAAQGLLTLRQQELAELENGTRPEEIEQMRAEVDAVQAEQTYLQEKSKRLQNLGNAAANEEREAAIAAAKTSTARLRKAEESLKLAVAGPRVEQIAQAKAAVAAQQALVDQLEDKIRKYTVITRFAGYITAEHTEVGEWIQVGDPVAEIAALDQVDVVAQVVEDHVSFIDRGASVRVELPSLPTAIFTGEVHRIVPKANLRSRTFPVKIRVDNEFVDGVPQIKSGMYARAILPTGDLRKALLTPKDSLVLGGPQPMIYVVVDQGGKTVAKPVPVQLGIAVGNLIQISPLGGAPLDKGARVVVEGNERLRPNQEVSIQQTRATPEVDALPKSREK